jgi:hypothetical protein
MLAFDLYVKISAEIEKSETAQLPKERTGKKKELKRKQAIKVSQVTKKFGELWKMILGLGAILHNPRVQVSPLWLYRLNCKTGRPQIARCEFRSYVQNASNVYNLHHLAMQFAFALKHPFSLSKL